MPPTPAPTQAQQDFIQAFSSLDPTVRGSLMQLVLQLASCGHRQEQAQFLLDLMTRLNQPSTLWPMLVGLGKQEISVSMVNGKVSSVKVGTHR